VDQAELVVGWVSRRRNPPTFFPRRRGGLRFANPPYEATSLLAESHRTQMKSEHIACGKLTRRANHQKPVHPFARKNSASVVGQISDPNLPVSPDKRGRAHVTNVAVGCGGRDDGARRTPDPRTAKSCGPDAPTLASSFREASFPEVKVARKPGRLGEHEVSRKPLRRESRCCSGSPVVLPPCLFHCTGPMGAIGTRLSLRPRLDGGESQARLGHVVPRGC
jgi:hypothetical protein